MFSQWSVPDNESCNKMDNKDTALVEYGNTNQAYVPSIDFMAAYPTIILCQGLDAHGPTYVEKKADVVFWVGFPQ